MYGTLLLQLTCMYSLLSANLSQNFAEYPADLLLYFKWVSIFLCSPRLQDKQTYFVSVIYSNQNVERVNCRSYFIALGGADLTVASSILNKNALLLSDAKDCLVSYIKRVYEKKISNDGHCLGANESLTIFRASAVSIWVEMMWRCWGTWPARWMPPTSRNLIHPFWRNSKPAKTFLMARWLPWRHCCCLGPRSTGMTIHLSAVTRQVEC